MRHEPTRCDCAQEFALGCLAQTGNRVLVTSRPDGVILKNYLAKGFIVYDLMPLNDIQQCQVVEKQLGENDFFHHLMAFSAIRVKHDVIFGAFPKDAQAELESFSAIDGFLLQSSTGEPHKDVRVHFCATSPFGTPHAFTCVLTD